MKAEITDIAPYRKRISIQVPREKVDEAFAEAYGKLQEVAEIKGFRRGHAPKRILERRFAKEVRQDVCAKLVETSLADVVKENKIALLTRPDIDIAKIEVSPGEAFGFTTEVDVRPSFALPAYKGMKLTRTAPAVRDEDVTAALARLQDAFAEEQETEGPASDELLLRVDLQVICEGKVALDHPDAVVPVSTTRLLGVEDKSLPDRLRGARAGTDIVFSLVFPTDYQDEAFRGKTGEVRLKVRKVLLRKAPALDDDFAKRCGQESMAALRSLIVKRLESERTEMTRNERIDEAKDLLIAACSFELPPEILQRMQKTIAARLRWRLRQRGVDENDINKQEEAIEKGAAEVAERDLRWSIIVDAIADEEKVEVTENDLQRHIEMVARSCQKTPAQLWREIQAMNGVADVISTIRELKTLQIIFQHAVLPENAGQASTAQPAAEATAPTAGDAQGKEEEKNASAS